MSPGRQNDAREKRKHESRWKPSPARTGQARSFHSEPAAVNGSVYEPEEDTSDAPCLLGQPAALKSVATPASRATP